jgi:hypothetical protein
MTEVADVIDCKFPPGWHDQDACCNCGHYFERTEFGQTEEVYCMNNAPKRPPCGAAWSGEEWDTNDKEAFRAAMLAWDHWRTGRNTRPSAICSQHVRKE